MVGDLRRRTLSTVRSGAFDAQFAGGDAIAFVGEREVLQLQRIDLPGGTMRGEPVQLGGPVRSGGNQIAFSAARNGRIVYLLSRKMSAPLVVDRNGVVRDTIVHTMSVPGAGHGASMLALGGDDGLFRYDLTREVATLLHKTPGRAVRAIAWSPDDSHIAFSDWCALRVIGRDGAGLRTVSDSPPGECLYVTDWFADERLLVTKTVSGKESEIWEYRLSDGAGELRVSGGGMAADASISKRGLMAYTAKAGNSLEVFVRAPQGTGAGVRVSIDGGRAPRWSRDGSEMFFVTPGGDVMSVAVSGMLKPALPQRLFRAPGWERSFFGTVSFRPFDVSPDGQRFYLTQSRIEGSAVLVQGAHSLLLGGRRSP